MMYAKKGKVKTRDLRTYDEKQLAKLHNQARREKDLAEKVKVQNTIIALQGLMLVEAGERLKRYNEGLVSVYRSIVGTRREIREMNENSNPTLDPLEKKAGKI